MVAVKGGDCGGGCERRVKGRKEINTSQVPKIDVFLCTNIVRMRPDEVRFVECLRVMYGRTHYARHIYG